jgi:hypothetical protein
VTGVRMLRIAVDLHRGRQPEPLDDPFGSGSLEVVESGGGVSVQSAGTTHGRRPLRREVSVPRVRFAERR